MSLESDKKRSRPDSPKKKEVLGMTGEDIKKDTHLCCFDYNVFWVSCAVPWCPYKCVYYDGGQENAGEWMTCQKGRGGRKFCNHHREHNIHEKYVNCYQTEEEAANEEDEEEEYEDDDVE